MAVGVVMVLLIGEIDLSIGEVSGFCAAVMAVLSVKANLPGLPAIAIGVLAGIAIGLFQGWWIARLHVPSFVVTLAGFLGWQGALLYILGSTGTVNLNDPLIVGLANTRLPVWLGWVIGVVFVGVFVLSMLAEQRRRRQVGMQLQSAVSMVGRSVAVAIAVFLADAIMSVNRSPAGFNPIEGVPSAVLFLIGFIVIFDFVTKSTRFGRYVFAVGGNAEAARRAGISVPRIRLTVFILSSLMAACGGILAGSRLLAVNQSSGGGDVLLTAIAAAVIGGTSLFGGRGNVWSALLGALVIGSISNGMDLLALSSSIKFMVTGAVLLAAVTIDAYVRSRRESAGR
jgi:D-xylose transport system permease protein